MSDLNALYGAYETKHNFKPGDRVKWKAGLKDRPFPDYGEPAVILEVIIGQKWDSGSSVPSPSPIQARIGAVGEGGSLDSVVVDIQRIEPA